jgi:hypothetical protein
VPVANRICNVRIEAAASCKITMANHHEQVIVQIRRLAADRRVRAKGSSSFWCE